MWAAVALIVGTRIRTQRRLQVSVADYIAEKELQNREVVLDVESTVRDCLVTVRRLQRSGDKAASRISELGLAWVTEPGGRLFGWVGATDLLLAEPETSMRRLAQQAPVVVYADDDLDDAVNDMRAQDVPVAPVIDDNERLVAVLAPADVIASIEAEATEDVARMAASGAISSYFDASKMSVVRSRASWLLSLLLLQSASAVVLTRFSSLLERNLLLALFLTMITGTSGNAGNQTSAVVIRALATGEISNADAFKVLRRELAIAAPLAFLLGVASFFRVVFTAGCQPAFSGLALRTGLTLAVAMALTVLCAVFVGTGAPLLLDKFGADPCNVASPALATFVDLAGVLVVCSIGQLLLPASVAPSRSLLAA